MLANKYEMDMCSGPLFKKILFFSFPLILTGLLQLLFNSVNIIVVGQYVGSQALAALGSTSALIMLLINLFIGLSLGASVCVAHCYGARDYEGVHRAVHTSVYISVISGVFVGAFGILTAKPLLLMMGTPDDVIDQAVLYMRIYFVGIPFNLIYNFGSAILRAVGDTRRPLYFLSVAGILNVGLNLVFVICINMGVAGAALATDLSQVLSSVLVIICLIKTDGSYALDLRKLKIYKKELSSIVKVGLPAGIQGALFSISNVLVQSSVNSFGSVVIAGNTAGMNAESYIYVSMNSMHQTTLTFASQNYGAGNLKRVDRVVAQCLAIVAFIGVAMGWMAIAFSDTIIGVFSSDPEVIKYGVLRITVIGILYFLCGMMDVMVGGLRGVEYSVTPMIVSLLGVCGFRIVWIFTAFAANRSLTTLYMSYPISWIFTFSAQLVCFLIVRRKIRKHVQLAEI